jgi:hypothetical protein
MGKPIVCHGITPFPSACWRPVFGFAVHRRNYCPRPSIFAVISAPYRSGNYIKSG